MPALAARQLYWILYGLAAAAVAWLVVTGALAAHDHQDAPERALRWRPADPEAHGRLAERALEAGKPDLARAHVLSALVRSPHDATLYRLLGEAARNGDEAFARRMFTRAGGLTHRDARLAAIFFEDAVRDERWDEAMTQADVLIRRSPRTESAVFFRLAVLAREPRFATALGKSLARNPAWRRGFFNELGASSIHLAAATQVVDAIRAAGGRTEPTELSPILVRMLNEGRAMEAHRLWASGLPIANRPPADEVYDPTFRDSRDGSPFGWSMAEHARSIVTFADEGLRIERGGTDAEALAAQRLVLQPGRYELESVGRRLEGEPLTLRWQVGCPGVPPLDLQLDGANPTTARGAFEVGPACAAPMLLLGATGRDRDAPSVGIVESVRIRRLG